MVDADDVKEFKYALTHKPTLRRVTVDETRFVSLEDVITLIEEMTPEGRKRTAEAIERHKRTIDLALGSGE